MVDRPNTNQTNGLSMKVLKGPKQIERENRIHLGSFPKVAKQSCSIKKR
jgi:hypothetical protein